MRHTTHKTLRSSRLPVVLRNVSDIDVVIGSKSHAGGLYYRLGHLKQSFADRLCEHLHGNNGTVNGGVAGVFCDDDRLTYSNTLVLLGLYL